MTITMIIIITPIILIMIIKLWKFFFFSFFFFFFLFFLSLFSFIYLLFLSFSVSPDPLFFRWSYIAPSLLFFFFFFSFSFYFCLLLIDISFDLQQAAHTSYNSRTNPAHLYHGVDIILKFDLDRPNFCAKPIWIEPIASQNQILFPSI